MRGCALVLPPTCCHVKRSSGCTHRRSLAQSCLRLCRATRLTGRALLCVPSTIESCKTALLVMLVPSQIQNKHPCDRSIQKRREQMSTLLGQKAHSINLIRVQRSPKGPLATTTLNFSPDTNTVSSFVSEYGLRLGSHTHAAQCVTVRCTVFLGFPVRSRSKGHGFSSITEREGRVLLGRTCATWSWVHIWRRHTREGTHGGCVLQSFIRHCTLLEYYDSRTRRTAGVAVPHWSKTSCGTSVDECWIEIAFNRIGAGRAEHKC